MIGWLRRHAMMLLGFAVSAALIALVFRKVDWAEMGKAFLGANYWVLLAGAAVGLCGFVIRALDWRFLLAPVGRFAVRRLFPPVAIGYMANNIFPARLGELVRAYVVGKREGVSKSAALATIVIERIFDGLTLLLILAIVSIFFQFPPWVKRGGWIVAAVFFGLSVFLAVVSVNLSFGLRLVDATLGRWLPGAAGQMKSRLECFVAGLDITRHWREAALAFLVCMARWATEACIYYSVVLAMGLPVPLYGVLFVMVVVNIATMVPSAPAYVGAVQFGCFVALSAIRGPGGAAVADQTTAAAYSVLLHAAIFFPITIAGIVCVFVSHIRFAALRRPQERAADGPMEASIPDVP